MKIAKFKPLFIATGVAMGMGLASFAYAASPVFEVTPPGPIVTDPFNADFINGFSSELLIGDVSASTLTATSGWLQFSTFKNGAAVVFPGVSGLLVDYQLYATFDLVANLSDGTFGTAGSSYDLSELNFTMWLDPDLDTTFIGAAVPGTAASVAVGAADINLASGELITGVAGFDALFGAYLNSKTTFVTTTDGDAFFTAPVPFYTLSFNAFNNTTPGVAISGDCADAAVDCVISINNAIGGIDFNQVPEPATLALLGMGLIGMGVSLRKRKAA